MAGINCVFLLGRLTRDPQIRLTPDGAEARFGLGLAHRSRDAAGEWRDTPCFVDIVAAGREADRAGAHLRKGRAVFVEGRLDYAAAESREARRGERLHVLAQRLTVLPRAVGAQPLDRDAPLALPVWVDQEG
jgi:single-strand DNA-binding protein